MKMTMELVENIKKMHEKTLLKGEKKGKNPNIHIKKALMEAEMKVKKSGDATKKEN